MKPRALLVVLIVLAGVLLFVRQPTNQIEELAQPEQEDGMVLPYVDGDFLPSEETGERGEIKITPANLQVRAIDLDGAPISAVSFVAKSPGVQQRVGYGNEVNWSDITPGNWEVSASADLYFPQTKHVVVNDGPPTQVDLALEPAAQIVGSVTNTYGAGLNGYYVYFLQEGETHPLSYQNKEDAIYARAGVRDGKFESPLLNPGKYSISPGPPSRRGAVNTRSIVLSGGERRTAEVIIQKGALLEIVVDNLGKQTIVSLLEFDPSAARRMERRRQIDRADLSEWGEKKKEDDSWRKLDKYKAKDFEGEKLRLNRIRPGKYRLEIKDTAGKFKSTESFEVFVDKPVRVSCSVPSWSQSKPDKQNESEEEKDRRKSWQELDLRVEVAPQGLPKESKPVIAIR